MDNAEYYEKYPDVNKSTIRSWKSRARQPIDEVISEEEAKKFIGAEEDEKFRIQTLFKLTGENPAIYKGIDNRSLIRILDGKKRVQDEEKKNKPTGSNSSIMPVTAAIGSVREEIGLSKYIEFDKNLNEIRMEIPLSKLMNPESNKALRE